MKTKAPSWNVPSRNEARRTLQRHWGYDDFRPGQWEIIEHVLHKRNVLAILPTGGGKSICYQVPALLFEGVTIVVSPLIALMQDQVAGLHARNVKATFINSALSTREIDQRWTDTEHGRYRLLYLAPERLDTRSFVARARRIPIALLAVDEAHCISEWGHHFRPSYLKIAAARKHMGTPPTMAVTATATPAVRKDILNRLGLRQPERIVRGFDRPNIVWSIFQTENKRSRVLDVLEGVPGSGILYASTRRGVEQWATWLSRRSPSVASYHGGMDGNVRKRMQDGWIAGDQRVMVATNAFGMGIDKPDVRFVIHVDLPTTLEGYYQEAGRGGRDGATAYAVLLYRAGDEDTPNRLIEESHPRPREIRNVYDTVGSLAQVAIGSMPDEPVAVRTGTVSQLTGLSTGKVRTAVSLLARQGAWQMLPLREHTGLIRLRRSIHDVRSEADRLSNPALAKFVYELLRVVPTSAFSTWQEIDLRVLERHVGLEEKRLQKGLEYLRMHAILDWMGPDQETRVVFLHARSTQLPIDSDQVRAAHERAQARIRDMIDFARSTSCRRRFLLDYFGETAPERCGTCDTCLGRHEAFVPTSTHQSIARGLLQDIAQSLPRERWLDDGQIPAYRIDQILNWLIREGYLVQSRPVGNAFELTPKARKMLATG